LQLKELFSRNKDVKDIRVIDMLVTKVRLPVSLEVMNEFFNELSS
jgi:hypothetical protein